MLYDKLGMQLAHRNMRTLKFATRQRAPVCNLP